MVFDQGQHGIDEIRLVVDNHLVARHRRHWGKEHTEYDPIHYLALLERKPGALDFARPLDGWELPGCFEVLRRRLEVQLSHKYERRLKTVALGRFRRSVEKRSAPGRPGWIQVSSGTGKVPVKLEDSEGQQGCLQTWM